MSILKSMDVISFLQPDGSIETLGRVSPPDLNASARTASLNKERTTWPLKRDYSFTASDNPFFAASQVSLGAQRGGGQSFTHNRPKPHSFEYAAANPFSASAMTGAFSGYEAFAFDSREESSSDSFFPLFGALVPIVVALCATFCIIAPALQNRFGYYYIEGKISFANDGAADSAMNSLLNAQANLPEDQEDPGENAALDIVEPITYTTYTVRGGDTVSGIAARFGLDNISTILAANGIENARKIRSGQRLTIPSMDGVKYKVQRGDSLSAIAAKFSVSLAAILDANDLADSKIAVGQELFVPGAKLSVQDLRKAMGELFIYPIRGRLTSRYGSRADPFTGAKSFHTGIDMAAPTGTSIKVSSDGRVAAAGWQNVYGNYAIVTHAGGYQTLYAHMSSLSVKRGQYLTQGDEVGKVGSTGYSTGPHLHFSVYKNGKTIDPFSVLD